MLRSVRMTADDLKFRILMWYTIQELHFSCWLWKLRGLKTCEEHGFHTQSWITGKCRKCENGRNKDIKRTL